MALDDSFAVNLILLGNLDFAGFGIRLFTGAYLFKIGTFSCTERGIFGLSEVAGTRNIGNFRGRYSLRQTLGNQNSLTFPLSLIHI